MITDGKMQKNITTRQRLCSTWFFFGRNKQQMSYFKVTQKIIEQE